MTRTTKVIGFSVPPAIVQELEEIAQEERRTKSQLLQEMLRVYQAYRKQRPESEIDEAWVMRLIAETQEEERQNPLSRQAFLAESKRLARYGAAQAKKLGIDVEDNEMINRMVHEARNARNKNRT